MHPGLLQDCISPQTPWLRHWTFSVLPNLPFKGRKFSKGCNKGKHWNHCTSVRQGQGEKSPMRRSQRGSELWTPPGMITPGKENTHQPENHFGKVDLGGPARTGELLAVLLSVTSFSLPFPEAGYPSSPDVLILLAFFTLLTTLLAFLMKRYSDTIYYKRSLVSKYLSLVFISDNT